MTAVPNEEATPSLEGAAPSGSGDEAITGPTMAVAPDPATATPVPLPAPTDWVAECPSGVSCDVVPAAYHVPDDTYPHGYGTYNLANRPADGLDIRYIVIHDTETSYSDAIKIFQRPTGTASANYVIRSSDGHITQMVRAQDIAHHAGNWHFNTHAIGIEHEGFAVQGATWYTETLYQASAKLVRYLAEKYQIPLDRAHIIGHDNVPGQTPAGQSGMHWDPGPFWDWEHYLALLGAPLGKTRHGTNNAIVVIAPGFATNPLALSDCNGPSCHTLAKQPANIISLRTAPSFDAPLIADPALARLLTTPGLGVTRVDDWGGTVAAGQRFYQAGRQGDWIAIYFGGQIAWFASPASRPNVLPGDGTLVTPRSGLTEISVYGEPYPEASAYPVGRQPAPVVPLDYRIPSGQIYVGTDLVQASFARPRPFAASTLDSTLVPGQTKYYQIFFNHRLAFVKADDVEVVNA